MFVSGDDITHSWLWPRLAKWFRRGDLLVTDTGTSYVGYWKGGLQPNTQIIDQILWSGIGYGVGAVQGAALATVELAKGRRTICFEGDGKCLEFTHERRCSGNYYTLFSTHCSKAIHHLSPQFERHHVRHRKRWLHNRRLFTSLNYPPRWQCGVGTLRTTISVEVYQISLGLYSRGTSW